MKDLTRILHDLDQGNINSDEAEKRVLRLFNVVGQSEQLMQSCSVCGTTKHPVLGANCKASNCPHEH